MSGKCKFLPILTASILSLCLVAAGCSGSTNSDTAPPQDGEQVDLPDETPQEVTNDDHDPVTILVAAAASLEYSYVDELIPMFQDLYPWITVEGTYDSSGKLQTQIEEGLEADVFMSAAMTQMNALAGQALVDADSVVELLENRIVLIAPADSDTEIASFAAIADAETVALGDPGSVPVGQYAREALTNLGIYDAVAARTSFGTNVTEVLNWVAEGSADVGIVYATDAATTENVKVIAELEDGVLETTVLYPVGIVATSANREAANLFVEFLQSDAALQVFENYGFSRN